jgi:hypothetical protein
MPISIDRAAVIQLNFTTSSILNKKAAYSTKKIRTSLSLDGFGELSSHSLDR